MRPNAVARFRSLEKFDGEPEILFFNGFKLRLGMDAVPVTYEASTQDVSDEDGYFVADMNFFDLSEDSLAEAWRMQGYTVEELTAKRLSEADSISALYYESFADDERITFVPLRLESLAFIDEEYDEHPVSASVISAYNESLVDAKKIRTAAKLQKKEPITVNATFRSLAKCKKDPAVMDVMGYELVRGESLIKLGFESKARLMHHEEDYLMVDFRSFYLDEDAFKENWDAYDYKLSDLTPSGLSHTKKISRIDYECYADEEENYFIPLVLESFAFIDEYGDMFKVSQSVIDAYNQSLLQREQA